MNAANAVAHCPPLPADTFRIALAAPLDATLNNDSD